MTHKQTWQVLPAYTDEPNRPLIGVTVDNGASFTIVAQLQSTWCAQTIVDAMNDAPELLRALIDIRDGAAYCKASKARAAIAIINSSGSDVCATERAPPPTPVSTNFFNAIRVTRRNGTVFVPLPRSAWVSCGPCACAHCNGADGFWDTLAVATDGEKFHYTWTVHAPEMQPGK